MADIAGTLDDEEFVALRRAAAVAHVVAGLSLTLRSGDAVVARVIPWVAPCQGQPWPVLSPCAFRAAVGRAWGDHRSGRPVALAGLCRAALTIDWMIERPGAVLGFGAVRGWYAGHMVWALASPLEPEPLGGVLDEAAERTAQAPLELGGVDASMLHDDLLGMSVVHLEAEQPSVAECALLDEVVRRLVATTTAAELVAEVSAGYV